MMTQQPRRRWGDRRDARRVRDIDAFHSYIAFLMPRRCDAEVYLNSQVDITDLLQYIEEKNKTSPVRITLFHCMVTALSRVIVMRPLLNRYIASRRYYERHQISMSFVAKKRFEDHAEEALMVLRPGEEDNLDSISRHIVGEVHQARNGQEDYGADSILKLLQRLPRPMMSLFMAFLRVADFYDFVPRSITDVDPNYTTVLLSNLGSIHCQAAYHHLNNFGTNSIMLTIGEMQKITGPEGDARDVVDLGLTVDERIADGFYFARCLRLMKFILQHPHLLDKPLKEAIEDED